MAKDPELIAHQQWLGYVQPVGLVVSIPALVQAPSPHQQNIAPDHQRFLECLPEDDKCPPAITDLAQFTQGGPRLGGGRPGGLQPASE